MTSRFWNSRAIRMKISPQIPTARRDHKLAVANRGGKQMYPRILGLCCLGALLMSAAPAFAAADTDPATATPHTDEAAKVISNLEHAQQLDQTRAQFYT